MQYSTLSWFTLAALTLGLTGNFGCERKVDQPKPPLAVTPTQPLRLWVIDDPPLAAAVRREWAARSESALVVESHTQAELLDGEQITADAVIYPSALIGTLAERGWIVPLPAAEDSQLELEEVFPLQRLRETRWGETSYAVTFGSPQLVLMYRADLFQSLQLSPPKTWDEYQTMVEKLAAQRPAAADWSPVVEPLGEAWRGEILIARAAAYARHRAHYSTFMNYIDLEPLIAGPPWQRALQELAAVARLTSPVMQDATPREARQLLQDGRCAAALCWPTAALDEKTNRQAETPPGPIAVAALPGSPEVYNFFDEQWEPRDTAGIATMPVLGAAGRLGSVTSVARRRRAAMNLLARLSGPQWSSNVASQSADTTLYRRSHLAAPGRWTGALLNDGAARDYAELVAQTQGGSDSMLTLRIPHRERYLAALNRAVQQAIKGEQSPEEALSQAAEQWRTLNQEIGTETAQRTYRQSLGLAP